MEISADTYLFAEGYMTGAWGMSTTPTPMVAITWQAMKLVLKIVQRRTNHDYPR